MTETPVIQGWCPGALQPMQSGDGLVVRVRPRGGRLSSEQAAGVAELADRHGNGLIDLSSRANVQIRGVTASSHPALIAGLDALGLIDATPQAERAHNIVVTPFWSTGDGTQDVAQALMLALAAPDAPTLPGKFGYAIDTGEAVVLRAVSADIRIERAATGLLVWADGAATGAVVASAVDAVAAIRELSDWFVEAGGIVGGRGRMAALVLRGAVLPARFRSVPVPVVPAFHPCPAVLPQGAMFGFEFGQMQAATLGTIARLGPLRLTPWRMVLVEGLGAQPEFAGLVTRTDDPLLRVVACTGAPACLQAHQPTRSLARELAPLWQGDVLHVSGCAKGCAHPAAATAAIVATPAGYDLVRNGTASAPPLQRGLSAAGVTQFLTEHPA